MDAIEERILTVTSVLQTYVRFPHVEQVYSEERHTTKLASLPVTKCTIK